MQQWKGASWGCGGDNGKIQYTCTTPVFTGGISTHETGCTDIGDGWLNYLDRFGSIDCAAHGTNKVMTRWHLSTPLPARAAKRPHFCFCPSHA